MLNKEKKIKCRDFARPAIGITEEPEVFVILLLSNKNREIRLQK